MRRLMLVCTLLVTACAVRAESPAMSELQEQYRQRLLAEVQRQGDPSGADIKSRSDALQQLAGRIAEEVFGGHADILRQESLAAWEKLPVLSEQRLAGYSRKLATTSFPQWKAAPRGSLLRWGFVPTSAAAAVVTTVSMREATPEAQFQRTMLRTLVGDQFFRVDKKEGYTVVVHSLDDYFRVDLVLNESGVFEPTRLEWLIKAAAGAQPSPATQPATAPAAGAAAH